MPTPITPADLEATVKKWEHIPGADWKEHSRKLKQEPGYQEDYLSFKTLKYSVALAKYLMQQGSGFSLSPGQIGLVKRLLTTIEDIDAYFTETQRHE